MEAKNFRIGNYIFEPENENKTPFKIWGIYQEPKNEKVNGYPITYFKPIPLTEEWLLKFGFIRTKTYLHHEKMGMVRLNIDGSLKFPNDIVHTVIKYVHELQNLFLRLLEKNLNMKQKTKHTLYCICWRFFFYYYKPLAGNVENMKSWLCTDFQNIRQMPDSQFFIFSVNYWHGKFSTNFN